MIYIYARFQGQAAPAGINTLFKRYLNYLKYPLADSGNLFTGARMYRSVIAALACPILSCISLTGTPKLARFEAKDRRAV